MSSTTSSKTIWSSWEVNLSGRADTAKQYTLASKILSVCAVWSDRSDVGVYLESHKLSWLDNAAAQLPEDALLFMRLEAAPLPALVSEGILPSLSVSGVDSAMFGIKFSWGTINLRVKPSKAWLGVEVICSLADKAARYHHLVDAMSHATRMPFHQLYAFVSNLERCQDNPPLLEGCCADAFANDESYKVSRIGWDRIGIERLEIRSFTRREAFTQQITDCYDRIQLHAGQISRVVFELSSQIEPLRRFYQRCVKKTVPVSLGWGFGSLGFVPMGYSNREMKRLTLPSDTAAALMTQQRYSCWNRRVITWAPLQWRLQQQITAKDSDNWLKCDARRDKAKITCSVSHEVDEQFVVDLAREMESISGVKAIIVRPSPQGKFDVEP